MTNSEDDGRNAMSIISGRKITISRFISEKVGGVVGGTVQPGGLDIEPNNSYQICEDITVGQASIVSAGAQCFGALGKDSGTAEDWIVRRIKIGALNSTCTAGARSPRRICSSSFPMRGRRRYTRLRDPSIYAQRHRTDRRQRKERKNPHEDRSRFVWGRR